VEEAKSRNESLEAENGATRERSMRRILELERFQADLTWLLRAEERDNGSNRAIAAALRSDASSHAATVARLEAVLASARAQVEEAKSRNESLEAENGAAREGSMRLILDLELFQADLTWLLRAKERDNGLNRAIAAALRSLARFRQKFADNKELEREKDDVKARYDQELARLSQELADTKTRLELACHVSEIVAAVVFVAVAAAIITIG